MPEGPEIRQSRDALAKVLKGKKLSKITIGLESLKASQPAIAGQTVLDVDCQGKAMLIHLKNGKTIYSHNQLYGKWVIIDDDELPESNRSLRLGLFTDKQSALLYSASDIELWDTDCLCDHPFLSKLGPDILASDTTPEIIQQRLQSKRFRRRSLSALYLDQHFIAGIGNYLRSEILFYAGCDATARPMDYDDDAMQKLAEQTADVALRSYKTFGYTVPEKAYKQALKEKADYYSSRFMVFDREGEPCRVCGTLIRKRTLSGRRLYDCPECQPAVK